MTYDISQTKIFHKNMKHYTRQVNNKCSRWDRKHMFTCQASLNHMDTKTPARHEATETKGGNNYEINNSAGCDTTDACRTAADVSVCPQRCQVISLSSFDITGRETSNSLQHSVCILHWFFTSPASECSTVIFISVVQPKAASFHKNTFIIMLS